MLLKMISQNRALKIVFSLALVSFLLLGTFGFSHAGMIMEMDGRMTDCPFAPGVAICNMTPLEMIAASQNLLTTLPQQKDPAYLLLLLAAAAFALIFFWKPFSPLRVSLVPIPISNREYMPLHSYLQEAFSNGILNPKLF